MADEVRNEEKHEHHEHGNSDECCGHGDWHGHHHNHHRKNWHRGGTVMAGPIWFIGWLFTIGYCQLPFFWKGVLGLVAWPYYLGQFLIQMRGM
jgi:hypothetical protein